MLFSGQSGFRNCEAPGLLQESRALRARSVPKSVPESVPENQGVSEGVSEGGVSGARRAPGSGVSKKCPRVSGTPFF